MRAYIASQGPTKDILVDFWRMVWQLRVGKVVMLTNLLEDEKAGEKKRQLVHIHFTAWPDKRVPKYASSLVHFRHKVETTAVKENGPVIVHCSTGVGRTGTFIALNVLTEQALSMGYVDPVGCVNTLRRQRVDMIQTPDQYIFLHMTLETLMQSTSALSASQFLASYKELMAFDNDHRRRKIDVKFSVSKTCQFVLRIFRMEKMFPVADECKYVSAKEVRNRNKNRYTNILPVADHMPYLTPSGKRSEPDYINAVFLPNNKKKGAFIITKTPLKVTKNDFMRMVVEHDVHTIEDEIYWPENEDHTLIQNMTIGKTGEECEGGLRKITLDLNRFGKTRKLQLIQFEGWPDDSALPSSPKDIINLFDAVQYWQHQSGNNPVLVHCMNGADRSGLYCVVSAVLERMRIEQDVAITQVINEMRNYREQIVPSLFCRIATGKDSKMCYPGYQLKGRFNWNTCRNSGWRFELQTCILVTCICPPLQYGSYITKHNNIVCRGYQSVSTIIVPDCNEGYYPKAVSEQTCTDRSSWKGSIPTCLSVKCNAPEMIKNGMYFLESYSDYTYNYVINFTCNTGYRLLSSIRTRKCEKNLQWTGPAPVCEIITCQKPPSNSHGYYSVAGQDQELKKDMYEFNTTVIPHCNLGYVSRSYPSIRVCNSNGLWTGANLTCEPVRCHVKPLVDSNYTLLSNRTVLHDSYIPINTVVYHECAKGYYMTSPQTTRTCQFNGSLSGSEPRCNQVSCVSTTEKVERVMKCVQYWPDEGSIEYDIFKITHRSTEPFSDFVIRKLALQKDGEDERMVYHFHFTSWPDKSVPQYASSLVHFRQKIVNAVIKDKGPDIVHCSAGVGRTGTFIALNILTEQASTVGYVDPDQYIFLHMALLETLMLSTSALPASEFLRVYEELLSFDKDRRKLDVQFSRMEKMSPVADECQYVSAKDVRNRNKNRYSNILPVADHMPHLTPSGKRSEPEYINAVLLPGYKKKGAFIVTQTPLEATKTDFWRLVVEHDVHTIVMMNNRSEMKEDEIYWPENGDSETYDNMTIEKTCEECEGWPDDSALPSSPRSVIHLLDAVQYWHHQSGNNPVLVHCMNGADRSGLFCVASVVLERMKIEQDVAITQVIKEMRNYREHIIPSLEQFQFVHEVVKEYILQNETYSNFTD
ncbi:PTPRU-like protein [Mya arenaria]|uniref:protein-tyrosine-phosphatase n=1 Tax=Mya arenaria TaxID=6604 RepID=A0ABY7FQL4_MYAAR|nr:PTPRU-like protein [Mya arenaria]